MHYISATSVAAAAAIIAADTRCKSMMQHWCKNALQPADILACSKYWLKAKVSIQTYFKAQNFTWQFIATKRIQIWNNLTILLFIWTDLTALTF